MINVTEFTHSHEYWETLKRGLKVKLTVKLLGTIVNVELSLIDEKVRPMYLRNPTWYFPGKVQSQVP